MSKLSAARNLRTFHLDLIKNMISLATSGFGVVVALAWNEAIQKTVEEFIKPYFGGNSGIITLFIYAVVVTILAVLVTTQLSVIEKRLEKPVTKVDEK